ncbi:hypothetical protein DCAR_0727333 [Daucus carota subsp. sativus]|uniref:Uncharacterized protein n=1 Tax=Daucus carota subsp. sativus TaxID=79200 RepID=A0A161ZIH2_DAUCS|nr:PREDICTED: uncharacterized protein LOC108195319 [Daucus carota subsp. sativus]WOH07899.1 hypothetical protein DCAR_0727333 [Daucus carota subsp. sativus]
MEGEKQKKVLDRETRDMVSALNRRLQSLHKMQLGGDTSHNDDDETDDDHGVRVITLAGTNVGATMRSELDDNDGDVDDDSENDPLATFVNSNIQAINNSIMLDGSYSTNDPGVHLEICDKQEAKTEQVKQMRGKKKEGGAKKKGNKSSKSEQHTDGNSSN